MHSRVRHSNFSRPGMSRTPGLILAVVTGVVGIGAVWAFSYFLRTPVVPIGGRTGSATSVAPGTRPPVVDLSTPPSRTQSGVGTRIHSSSGATVQWADKNDPSRLAGEMRYATLDPLGDKRYNVTAPQGWMFLRDGGVIYLEAKGGNVFIADEAVSRRPDSGTLTGGVTIKVFKKKPDGSRHDPNVDLAYATTTMDTLSFDGTTGEISTPDVVRAVLDNATFSGRGLTIIFNELKDRVEYFEIREGDKLVIKPQKSSAAADAASTPAPANQAAAAGDGSAPTPPANTATPVATPAQVSAPITRTQYRAVFGSDVRLSQGTREVKSEQLECFAVLLNGRLSSDAFGKPASSTSLSQPSSGGKDPATAAPSTAQSATQSTAPSAAVPAAVPADSAANSTTNPAGDSASRAAPLPSTPASSTDTADVILTWSGPLVARTVDEAIAELVKDDVSMRFTSPIGGTVYIDDPSIGARGTAPVLNYFATRREIAMISPAPRGVSLDLKDNGTVLGESLALNLATGVAHARGPGIITGMLASAANKSSDASNPTPSEPTAATTAAPVNPTQPQTIQWSDQADFVFAMRNGRVTNQLQEAILAGAVQAKGDGSQLDAGWLRVVFAAESAGSRISRLEAKDDVVGSDASGGTLAGQDVQVAFATDAKGRATPDRLIARTAAKATRGKDVIEGGVIDARLGLDKDGKSEIKTLTARESAHVQSADGVDARGHEITFDVSAQRARLTGRGAVDATATKDATTISGPIVEVDGVARTIGVPGPGLLTHVQTPLKDGFVPKVEARWTTSMTFDDRKGDAALAGSVQAVWTPDAISTDKVTGQTITIALTPGPADQPAIADVPGSDGKSAAAKAHPREVLRAIARGGENSPASMESRRVVSATDRTLASLTFIQGATIDADNVAQTLTVPGSGKLLSVDRRQPSAPAASSSDPFAQSRGQGDALFTWSDSMTAFRAQDRAEMRGNVQVVHLRAGDAEPTELHSRELVATIRQNASPSQASASAPGGLTGGGSLSQLIATGGVWARSSTKREMTSDRMIYDAVQGVMLLTADGGRDVTVFDPAARAPLTSKAIEWDLKKDRVRIVSPGSISTGR